MTKKQRQSGSRRPRSFYTDQEAKRIVTVRVTEAENKKLKDENRALKRSLSDTQDTLADWMSKYHVVDKQHGILNARLDTAFAAEVVKFILSSLGVGFGFYFLSLSRQLLGFGSLLTCFLLYGVVVFWQTQKR